MSAAIRCGSFGSRVLRMTDHSVDWIWLADSSSAGDHSLEYVAIAWTPALSSARERSYLEILDFRHQTSDFKKRRRQSLNNQEI
jgi:hypothetical protein